MNWLQKISRRRFKPNDSVRFFTSPRKGKGKNIVLTPSFQKGKVVDFDAETRRYKVDTDGNIYDVHPRNIVHDTIMSGSSAVEPNSTGTIPDMVQPFPR